MTDWHHLNHAYGSAEDIPPQLAQLSPNCFEDTWHDLWSCLCHQGTVYSASFAALPFLLDFATQCKAEERFDALFLAGSILASTDVQGRRDNFLQPVAWVIPEFQRLCHESLALRRTSQENFIYLLQAARGFEGDQTWGQLLCRTVDEEFSGACPCCNVSLHLVIGKDGCFTKVPDWSSRPTTNRMAILPSQDITDDAGQWMYQWAQYSEQYQVAGWLEYIFGSSICPSCGEEFQVSDAITAPYPRENF